MYVNGQFQSAQYLPENSTSEARVSYHPKSPLMKIRHNLIETCQALIKLRSFIRYYLPLLAVCSGFFRHFDIAHSWCDHKLKYHVNIFDRLISLYKYILYATLVNEQEFVKTTNNIALSSYHFLF